MDNAVDSVYLGLTDAEVKVVLVGIFFHLDDPESDKPPTHLKYDLRMQKYWFTDFVYPYFQIPGPRDFTGLWINNLNNVIFLPWISCFQ